MININLLEDEEKGKWLFIRNLYHKYKLYQNKNKYKNLLHKPDKDFDDHHKMYSLSNKIAKTAGKLEGINKFKMNQEKEKLENLHKSKDSGFMHTWKKFKTRYDMEGYEDKAKDYAKEKNEFLGRADSHIDKSTSAVRN